SLARPDDRRPACTGDHHVGLLPRPQHLHQRGLHLLIEAHDVVENRGAHRALTATRETAVALLYRVARPLIRRIHVLLRLLQEPDPFSSMPQSPRGGRSLASALVFGK